MRRLQRLELLERLAAALAVADRAARRGAEEILELRLRRAAVRTTEAALELDEVELRRDPRCGRRETGSAELLAAGGGDVVRRPRVVQADADLRVEAELADLLLHRLPHHFERGTAHERRCELDSRRSCVDGHVLHDTEVDERDHGDLGIGDLGERLPDRLGGHHCAPAGAERRTIVISSQSSASSASWTPRGTASTSGSLRPSFASARSRSAGWSSSSRTPSA